MTAAAAVAVAVLLLLLLLCAFVRVCLRVSEAGFNLALINGSHVVLLGLFALCPCDVCGISNLPPRPETVSEGEMCSQ